MTDRHPPKRLPRDFHEIWQELSTADQSAPSRQVLARRLGLSTYTLQRILVDGDVPRFSRTDNTRVLRSWTRTLTRLALHFRRDPRRWIEMVGIPWDAATQAVCREAAQRLSQRSATAELSGPGGLSGAPAGSGDAGLSGFAQISMQKGPGRPGSRSLAAGGTLHIGLVRRAPFSVPLADGTGSFLEQFVRRLLGSWDCGLALQFHDLGEGEAVDAMLRAEPELQLTVGILETAGRRRSGISFVRIPGWRVRLAGLSLVPRHGQALPPTWSEATRADSSARPMLLVREGSAAHQYLSGPCAVPSDRIVIHTESDEAVLAQVFRREVESRARSWVLLAGDSGECRRVRALLAASESSASDSSSPGPIGSNRGYDPVLLEDTRDEAPEYPLALALPPGRHALSRRLRFTRDQDLFRAMPRVMAASYAALVHTVHRFPEYGEWVRLRRFRGAGPEFQDALCRSLFLSLRQDSPSLERSVDAAQALLPPSWGDRFRAFGAENAVHSSPRLCRSCAASLRDEHNRGVSNQYCRYCADERGNLKPREQVRSILAEWLRAWQGEMAPEDALGRADQFMSLMPAWRKN